MKKKILLTYAMYGNGHRAIAEYIESYFKLVGHLYIVYLIQKLVQLLLIKQV